MTPLIMETLIRESLSLIENYVTSAYNQQGKELTKEELRDVRPLRREVFILSSSFAFLSRALNLNRQFIDLVYSYPQI